MSKVAVKGAVAGTGVFTLESPGTNTDRTFTLPDGDGELVRAAAVGGMPLAGSDPVVESGSNSDGEWTRWADGTQTCHGAVLGIDATEAIGSIFRTPVASIGVAWTFPAVFIADPKCIANTGSNYRWGTAGSLTPTYSYVKLISAVSSTYGGADLIAIGRWK